MLATSEERQPPFIRYFIHCPEKQMRFNRWLMSDLGCLIYTESSPYKAIKVTARDRPSRRGRDPDNARDEKETNSCSYLNVHFHVLANKLVQRKRSRLLFWRCSVRVITDTSVVFSVLPRKFRHSTRSAHERLLPHPSQFIIHPTLHSLNIESVVK